MDAETAPAPAATDRRRSTVDEAQRPALSVVIPTFNERTNLPLLIAALDAALAGIAWEAVVVDDDSPDGTWEVAEGLIAAHQHLHLIRRIGRRGLSSAVIEGFHAGRGRFLAVIDADLQHDESILRAMLAKAETGQLDLVMGTRYDQGGGTGKWSRRRLVMSRLATWLSRLVLGQQVSDPMSGFFLIRREAFVTVEPRLDPRGFKILMEILGRSRGLRQGDVGYVFRPRQHGESKLDAAVGWAFLRALYDLSLGRVLPWRLVVYVLVGLSGVAVNLAVLALLVRGFGVERDPALVAAISAAMLSNFLLNNRITFRDHALGGWAAARGLILFVIICGIGALANYAVTGHLHERLQWNLYLADIAGIAVATMWNFTLNRWLTWGGDDR